MADFPTTLGSQTTGDGVKLARDLGARLVAARIEEGEGRVGEGFRVEEWVELPGKTSKDLVFP